MKKGLLFLISLFLMVSTVGAMQNTKQGNHTSDYKPFYNDEAIEFTERGIKFYIFLDGQFDFNTAPTAYVDYEYRSRRGSRKYKTKRGVRIERDYQGRIRRVGNVFISYTHRNKIKRIGSVFVKYRRDQMKKVGNLKIYYDRYGVRFVGNVKRQAHYNPYYSYGWSSYNNWSSWNSWDTWEYGYYDSFFNDDDFYDNYESYDEDANYYYYRSKSNNKGERATKGKVIKRKKAVKSKRDEVRRKVATPKREIQKNRKRK